MKRPAQKTLPALIFDLDGTLWNAVKPISEAWTEVGRAFFSPDYCLSEEDTQNLMGLTMDEIVNRLMIADLDEPTKRRFTERCFSYEREYLVEHPGKLFPNEIETLLSLKRKGYRLFIVSNCQSGYIETFLPLCEPGLFEGHLCWSDTEQDKHVTIRALMDKFDLKEAIYIGDTQKDLNETRLAGIAFLHAAYGFGTADRPDGRAHDFAQLFSEIERLSC